MSDIISFYEILNAKLVLNGENNMKLGEKFSMHDLKVSLLAGKTSRKIIFLIVTIQLPRSVILYKSS